MYSEEEEEEERRRRRKEENGLNVILDCKTRWSSLVNMLERIVKIKVPIQRRCWIGLYVNDEEFRLKSSIVDALSPIKKSTETTRNDVFHV